MRIDLGEIRPHKIPDPFRRTRQGDGIDGKGDDEDEKDRHRHFRESLDAFLHAGEDDARDQEHEDGMDRDRAAGGGDELSEKSLDISRFRFGKVQAHGLEQVFHRPAAHDAVVAQDDDGRDDREKSQPFPGRAGGQFFHRSEGPLAAAPADDRLREEDGEDQDETRQHVHDDEGRTAVLPHHVGKTPDIAQADGASRHRHDHRKAAAEILARGHQNRLEINRMMTPTGAT